MADLTHKVSPWQRIVYDDQVKSQPDLASVEADGTRRVSKAWPDFQREVMARLYEPATPALDPATRGSSWAQEFHAQAAQLPEWQRLAKRVQGDAFMSGMATASVAEALLETVPPEAPRQDQSPADLAELEQAIDEQAASGEMTEDQARRMRDMLERLLAETVEQDEAIGESLDENVVRGRVRQAIDAAQKQIDAVEGMLSGCGFDPTASEGSRSSAALKMALASRLRDSDRIRRILRLAGRFRRMANAKMRVRPRRGAGELSDIEMGNDLARLLPSETVALTDPDLELLFDRRYMERGLMQYRLQERPVEGLGPIIFCCDESGSMQGDKEVWAKAIFAGLTEIALKQKRTVGFLAFGGTVRREKVWENGKYDPVEFVETVEEFACDSWTSFDEVLSRAVELIRGDKRLKKADIVFLTDGEAPRPNNGIAALTKLRAACQVKTFGIAITDHGSAADLTSFCDEVVTVRDVVREARGVTDKLFESIV